MSKRPISWRPTERTPEGWVNVYYPSADPFGEEVTVVLDVDGEREVEAARARGDVRVTLTKGAFAGVTFRTNMETGSRLYGDGRTERYGQRAPLPRHPRFRPWNRPAWATSMVVDRLRSIAFCPPSTLSAAAIDAARDVLDHKLVEGEELAGGGDELVERLARGVQDALNRFVVERVRYHNPRPIPSRRFMTPPLELHQAERVRRAFAGRVGMVAMGSWRMIGRVARLLVLPPEPIEWDLWFMISNIEHGWATSIHGTDGDLGVNDFDLGLHFGGPWGMPRWLSDAEVDELDELAMVDSAHGRVPWLSARLADYLRDGFGPSGAELADTWLKQEAERERERSKQVSAPNAPAFALPGWADRWRTYVTPPAFAALALAVWWSEVRPDVVALAKAIERAERHRPALPAAAHQQILAFHNARGAREHTREGQRIATWTQADGAEVSVRLDPGLDAATIGDLLGGRIRFGVAHIRVLDLILRKLGDRLADGGMPVDGVPRLEIPKGKKLAEALKLGRSGQAGADADAALDFFARVELIDGRGNIARLWGPPEARSNAPGRAAAWLVTPGELIRPTMVQRQPTHMPDWRQLVPWPDELPDDGWLNPRQRVDLHLLVMATALRWRKAAGAGHGVPWAERPGFELTDRAIAELGHGLEWKLTARTLADAGWWAITGRLITPGERLPRLRDDLDRAAEGARKKASPKKRR